MGEARQALAYYEKALELRKAAGNLSGLASNHVEQYRIVVLSDRRTTKGPRVLYQGVGNTRAHPRSTRPAHYLVEHGKALLRGGEALRGRTPVGTASCPRRGSRRSRL